FGRPARPALPAGAVHLAQPLAEEILNDEFPVAVVLEQLVVRVHGAAAVDGDGSRGAFGRGHRVVTHELPPHVLDGAAAAAVNAVGAVVADDHVLNGGAVPQLEEGVRRPLPGRAGAAAILGEIAGAAAVVQSHVPVVRGAGGDGAGRRDADRRA